MKLKELFESTTPDWQILLEEPQVIGDVDWNLSDAKANKALRRELNNLHSKIELPDFRGLKLYRKKGQIWAIRENLDPESDQIKLVYWVKTDVKKITAVHTSALTQRALWRYTIPQTFGLTTYVFWNIWLPEFKTIASDGLQTEKGKTFWSNRVAEAFDRDVNVYVVNELAPRSVKKIRNHEEFSELMDNRKIWGTEPRFKNIKVLLSSLELKEKDEAKAD